MTDRILLLSHETADQQFVEAVSRCMSIPLLQSEAEMRGAPEKVATFCGVDQGARAPIACAEVHLLSIPFRSDELSRMVLEPKVTGMVFRGQQGAEECAEVYSRALRPSSSGGLGLKELLSPGATVVERTLTEACHRQGALQDVERFLEENECQSRVLPAIMTAADELLMNGIFDAPHEPDGTMRHQMTPRSSNFPLDGRDQVTISVGTDGTYLGISVLDWHGSLCGDKVLRHVAACLKPIHYTVDNTKAGAGLGLGMTLHSGANLVFCVSPGKRTEVSALFRKSESFAKLRSQFQFVVSRRLLAERG